MNLFSKKKIHFIQILKLLCVGLAILIMLEGTVNIWSIQYVRRQTYYNVKTAVDYYTEKFEKNLEKVTDMLEELAVINLNVQSVKYATDNLTLIQNAQKVNQYLDFYQESYGYEYHFFVFYKNRDYYNSSAKGSLIQPMRSNWNKKISGYIQTDYEKRNQNYPERWQIGLVDGEYVAFHYVTYQGVYACCYVFLTDIQQSSDFLGMGKDSYMTMISPDHIPYGNVEKLQKDGFYNADDGKVMKKDKLFHFEVIREKKIVCGDFSIFSVISNNPVMEQSIWIQIILFILLLLALAFAAGMLYLIRNRMVRSVQYFADSLEQITSNQDEVYYEDNSIHELAKANELFRQIIGQMKELKIEMYEQTLEKKELEIEKRQLAIDYLQLQIQPHFYINCLTMIYNLAGIGDYETIELLACHVSEYFRYIFKKHSDYAKLSEELLHVQNYLEICKINKPSQLEYQVQQSDDLSDVVIPMLLLHTFVENAVKYGTARDGKIYIMVKAERILINETEFVSIGIEDRGKGFPESVLDKLYDGDEIVTDKGTRIGIRNCLVRLKLLYQGKEKVNFFNLDGGGACIKICIPIDRREKNNEYTAD